MPEPTNSAQLTLALALSPWRERPELLSRLAPLNPLASGARDVPARSGSECNRRLGEGSGTSRLSEPLRSGTGRAPKEGSRAGNAQSPPWEESPTVGRIAELRKFLPLPGGPVLRSSPVEHGPFLRAAAGTLQAVGPSGTAEGGEGRGEGERLIPVNSYGLAHASE